MNLPEYILVRKASPSPRNGKCMECKCIIAAGTMSHRALRVRGGNTRFPCKLCTACAPPETPSMSKDEMKKARKLINTELCALRRKYLTNEVDAVGGDLMALASNARFNASNGRPFGFYGKTCSDGKVFKQRHPFSNFHLEPVTVGSQYVFRCGEAAIMMCKALQFKDAQVAYALSKYGSSLSGTSCKVLGRMVQNFKKSKWSGSKILALAHYVVLLKNEQCPQFKKELQRVKDCGYAKIYECSKSDAIWGTGTTIETAKESEYCNLPGTNYLGRALTLLVDVV